MSHPNDQHLSLKDRITSHLPGHKNQDNNANGIPDRLEKKASATHNSTGYVAPGATIVPGQTASVTTTTVTKDVNGRPIQGNVLEDKVVTSTTVAREPAMVQTSAFPVATDLNRNGIPDQLERSGSFGQTGFTDLNRNGIPDQLEGQGFGFVGSVAANTTSVVDVREAPVIVEKIEKPAVVHEVYKTEEVVQIQPVIEREREQLDVYEVVQPMREREVIATEVREAVLPAQTRAVVVEDNSAFLAARSVPGEFSTREVAATRSQVIENAPIVHETIVHKVIEEVQPVIYKEVDRPVLIKETLPIYEKIVEAPHAHHTVLPVRDLGVRTVSTTTTGFTDLNRDGIPDQLQGGMYQTTGLQSGLTSTGFTDLNRNGIPDQLEGRQGMGLSQDLNRNGIPDRLETRQSGLMTTGMTDLNRNGIPDQLETRQSGLMSTGMTDLNRNGIPDQLEMRPGQVGYQPSGLLSQPQVIPSTLTQPMMAKPGDLNGNGIPDSLERKMNQASLNTRM